MLFEDNNELNVIVVDDRQIIMIKHGLDLDLDPLHILISTRETNSGSEIIVEDDGVGFQFDDTKENFALQNIKKRLEIFCGGTLTISPREGGGTVVKIFVPTKK